MTSLHKLAALAVGALLLVGCTPASQSPDESAWDACVAANNDHEGAVEGCGVYLDRVGQEWFNARWNEGVVPPRECAKHDATEDCPAIG